MPIYYGKSVTTLISAYQAPGEAEAELAAFEKHGIINFAITLDSDYFLFGGTRLIWKLVLIEYVRGVAFY